LSDKFDVQLPTSDVASRLYGRQETDDVGVGDAIQSNQVKVVGKRGAKTKDSYTVSGYVKDKRSGEPLTGALVRVDNSTDGALTDAFGFYSITTKPAKAKWMVQFTGMKTISQTIDLIGDGKLDFQMEQSVSQLREVVVESDHDANVSAVQMGVSRIDISTMKEVPKIFGENDVLKVATTLPGVKTIGEGASGLNVRGGHADQNLVLLNEATIYNTSHFLGFFSIFNPDALRSFELYKSGMPVQHGGRLSSVFELLMRDGNKKKFSGQGGLGPITSHLTLEVPVIKDKTSIMAGGRSTYSNWVLRLINDSQLKDTRAAFNDYFVRITHSPNDKNSLYLSMYRSNDEFNLSTDTLFSYSNTLASLQWRHVFSTKTDAIFTLTRSGYKYDMDHSADPKAAFQLGFGIQESNFKAEVNHARGPHKFTYGLQTKLYQLDPGFILRTNDSSRVEPRTLASESGVESALFISQEFDISPSLSIYYGIRYSHYAALGPRNVYEYTPGEPKTEDRIVDSVYYGGGQLAKTYHGPEYRMSVRFKINQETSLKASYNRTRQYIHMLSNTVSVSPTDTWKLSDSHIAPQVADQISFGAYRDFGKDIYEVSTELYYKWIDNMLDYKTGASLLVNDRIEQQVLQGNGKSYGVEFLLRKKAGKLTGWIGYSYSRALIQLNSPVSSEVINRGRYFPANFDKPHDMSVVTNYRITRRYSFSLNFSYSTGRPITYPVAAYRFGNAYRVQYSDRNAYRVPDYMRMDVGFNIEGNHKVRKLAHSFWSVSIYNVLGRDNPYSVFFRIMDEEIKAYQLSIFAVPIPTITYHFKF
jgi:hypothetical protein